MSLMSKCGRYIYQYTSYIFSKGLKHPLIHSPIFSLYKNIIGAPYFPTALYQILYPRVLQYPTALHMDNSLKSTEEKDEDK